jgi:hypothetical protein
VTVLQQPRGGRRRHRRRRRRWPAALAALLVLALVFLLGLSLGKALEDGPEPGVTVTAVRTLEPLPQEPAPTRP